MMRLLEPILPKILGKYLDRLAIPVKLVVNVGRRCI
jgi:hypothetical protein